jgi:hypothetical protein
MEVIQGLFAEHDIQHIMSATAEDQGVGSVRVNVRLEEVPLSEVLDALLGMNGLGYRVVADGVVVIAPLDRLSDWARSHEVQNVFQRGAIEQAHIADTRQLQDQIRLRMEGEMREFQESSAKIEALREQLESGELLDMEEITEQIAQAQVAMRRARAAQRESQRVLRESLRSDFTAPLGWNGENAMVTHVFHLSPERADEMQVVIQPLLSNEGNVIRGPQGVLIVNDREAVIDKVDEVLESIEARIDSASTSGGGERLIYRRTMAEGTESPVPGTQMRLQLIDVGDNGADGVRVVVSTPDVQIEEHIDIETPVILIDHEIRLEDVITSGDTPRAVIAVNQLPSKKVIRSMREGDTLNFRDLSVTMESVRGDDLGPGIDGAVDFTLNFPEGHEGGEEVKLTVAEGHTAEISGYTVAVLDTTPANWRREARADVEISQISDARADAIHIRNARAAERDAERENQ